MFTVAHLSDPHLGSMPEPGLQALLGKRILGYMSWNIRRKGVHIEPVLTALADDLRRSRPDHVVVTGDVTNISLPEEFTRAARWLRTLGEPEQVSVIPGNHDAYVGVPWQDSLGKWTEFMTGAAPEASGQARGAETAVQSMSEFPYVRRRGDVAIVGLSTAAPMPLNSAAGRLGTRQLQILEQQLEMLDREGLFRIVLIHHPPTDLGINRRKQLLDAEAFRSAIARRGAELILHGHTHRSSLVELPTPRGTVPVVGVPSASARAHNGKDHSRYHLYRIGPSTQGWMLQIEVRGVAPEHDRFLVEDQLRFELVGSRAATAGVG